MAGRGVARVGVRPQFQDRHSWHFSGFAGAGDSGGSRTKVPHPSALAPGRLGMTSCAGGGSGSAFVLALPGAGAETAPLQDPVVAEASSPPSSPRQNPEPRRYCVPTHAPVIPSEAQRQLRRVEEPPGASGVAPRWPLPSFFWGSLDSAPIAASLRMTFAHGPPSAARAHVTTSARSPSPGTGRG